MDYDARMIVNAIDAVNAIIAMYEERHRDDEATIIELYDRRKDLSSLLPEPSRVVDFRQGRWEFR